MKVNKYIFFQLCISCIALSAEAQETANRQLPPVRTSDPVVRHAAVVRPNLPIKSGGDAPRPKSTQSAVVPIRKADLSPAGGGALKNKDKTTVVLPSSSSAKEAGEQRSQTVPQSPPAATPRQ